MTNNSDSNEAHDARTPDAPGPDDPRFGFAVVTGAVRQLMESLTADDLSKSTPCSEFTVKELLEHLVMVMRRVNAIGTGAGWASVDQEAVDGGHAEHFAQAAHAVQATWGDPALLAGMYEVPWGELPGAPLMLTYTAELAVHGWDLATAVGRDFEIEDALLEGPLQAAMFIPAEGRETPEMPFDPVVDPGADAPTLLRLAGWMGRKVI